MYKHFIKPILFRFNPETAHNILFKFLAVLRHIPFANSIIRAIYKKDSPSLEKEVFGIRFPNPVGLAGGLDKNGEDTDIGDPWGYDINTFRICAAEISLCVDKIIEKITNERGE